MPCTCPICNQSFARQEHLDRHVRIHTREKPHGCSLCQKRFSRLDVLNRHVASHKQQTESPTPRAASRACIQCARDRVRCLRGQPCRRCSQRSLSCQYSPPHRARARQDQDGDQSGTHARVQVEEEAGTVHLAPTFETQTMDAMNCNNDTITTTTPSLATRLTAGPGHVATNAWAWMSTVEDARNMEHDILGPPDWSASRVNWLAPQYLDTVDFDALLADAAVSYRLQMEQPTLDAAHARSIPDSTHSSNSIDNAYYVHGTGARAPFGGCSHSRHSVGIAAPLHESELDAASSPHLTAADPLCPTAAYDSLVQAVVSESRMQSLDIGPAHVPSYQQIQVYVRQYFDIFHPIFPFLRKASFANDVSSEWLLLLAVSVVGSKLMQRLQGEGLSEALSRLLSNILRRRRYGFQPETGNDHDSSLFVPGQQAKARICPSLQVLQAGILNVACMLHSGIQILVERAHVERHYLAEACYSLRLIAKTPEDDNLRSVAEHSDRHFWTNWLKRESEIRTGMMIWFLDSMFLYEFDAKPLMQLEDAEATLPSYEDLWESPNLVQQGKRSQSSVTLLSAMETVYVEKRLPSDLGEFSIGLLVNAIYRNTKNNLAREQIRLNSWTPTALVQQRTEQIPVQQTWLHTTSTASGWRSSACDSLDILHWPANSKVAQFSGSEHHTILHLHLARLIILAPTTPIQAFANEFASSNQHFSRLQSGRISATARYQLFQWIVQDQCKVRLSAIHCGALYWHVRRYSCDSLLEPYALCIATLILWAYCTCMQLPEIVDALTHDLDNDHSEPSFLHLDRRLDDELDQTFVRTGHKMSAHMSNVGSLHDRNASAKILHEGIRLLSKDSPDASSGENGLLPVPGQLCCTWGVEGSYVNALRDLLQATANTTGASTS